MTSKEHISSVECISIEKRGYRPNRYYVYVLRVEWNNGDKHPIYRKYSSFYDFERTLREKLGNVAIPELPPVNVLAKAFKIEKNHVNTINEFCQKVMSLPIAIVHSHAVSAFFEVWNSDFLMDEPDDRAKKKEEKKKIVDSKNTKQESIDSLSTEVETDSLSTEVETAENGSVEKLAPSAPPDDDLMSMQVYTCIADYVPDSIEELSLKEGMKYVVLERNDDGWWFIMRESDGQQGYAPGSFLSLEQTAKSTDTENAYSDIPSVLDKTIIDDMMKVRALSDYVASNEDEMSCKVGDELEVLHRDSTGWWTVRSHGKVGLVPAVHLEPSPNSARASDSFFRNNSLYARKPPPRRQTESLERSDKPPNIAVDPDYSNVDDFTTSMAGRRLVPPTIKSKSEGLLNYAELVFDEQTDKPVVDEKLDEPQGFVKAASSNALGVNRATPKKQDTIIYTEIVPKTLQKPEEVVHDPSLAGRKPERGKALKKPAVPKLEEPKAATRSASPPCSLSPPTSLEGRESPGPVKPRTARHHEPMHNYENHSVPLQTLNGGPPKESHTYINLSLPASSKTSDISTSSKPSVVAPPKAVVPTPLKPSAAAPQKAVVPTPSKPSVAPPQKAVVPTPSKPSVAPPQKAVVPTPLKASVAAPQKAIITPQKASITPQKANSPEYLRRASIDPPPAPTVEAPIPSTSNHSPSSLDSYSPTMSRVQASASYDGPPISGMLMFTKGDTATLMSKISDIGWWYVNLKGLEGYVPGGYWEACSAVASPQSKPKAPQPVPRTRSPPNTEKSGFDQEPWHHGKLSRPESEKLLANFSNGVYVIRESVNRVGDLTLSVRWEGKTRHFPIEAKEGGLYYIGKHDFKTLKGVITHYSKHALFYSDSNEPVKLKTPAKKSST